jgi:uncharacterized membrane protein SpoIIM required for sporulation
MKTKETTCAINEECIRTFFNKDTMNLIIKIFGGLLTAFVVYTFSYSYYQIQAQETIRERLLVVEHKQGVRDSMMISKLDSLLKRE